MRNYPYFFVQILKYYLWILTKSKILSRFKVFNEFKLAKLKLRKYKLHLLLTTKTLFNK